MRITYGMSAQTSLRNIQRNQTRMADLEGQLTSTSRLSKPSDDPIGVARALGFQQSIDQSDQFLKNIDQGTNWLNNTDAALGGVSSEIIRARELAVNAANGTLSPEDKNAIQLEITQLQDSVLDLSNSKVGSSYLFSGTNSTQSGYQRAVSSQVDPTAYRGNASSVQREVSPGVAVSVNASAQSTFDPVFKALATLQAGLVPQANAPATSTPAVTTGGAPQPLGVGVGGSLSINGVSVSLPTGTDAATAAGIINGTAGLQGASGVVASLSAAPGPVGNLVLTSRSTGAEASVTIGAPVPAGTTISADLGLSPSSVSGLDSATDIRAKLQQSLTDLDLAVDAINISRSGVGAKMNRLETLQGQQQSVNLNLTGLLSEVKDVDIASAITQFTMAQTVYTASLKSASQSLQSSLMDFLR